MATNTGGTVVQRFGSRVAGIVERWMPSPFLFAILLSYLVFLGGIVIEGAGPAAMVGYWYDGFWTLLTFAMQMVLILATGYVVAYHPIVRRAIARLTAIPNNGKQAVVLVGVIAMVVTWIQWGLGLIVGAVLAREMGRQANERGLSVHYPLLCVAGYMGMGLTWHWGLAGSAPLLMNTPNNVFIEQGIVDGLISTSQTVFSTYSLALTVLAIIYAAIVLYLLAPPSGETDGITEFVPASRLGGSATDSAGATAADGGERAFGARTSSGERSESDGGEREGTEREPRRSAERSDGGTAAAGSKGERMTPSDRINNSRVIGGIIALTGVGVAVWTFSQEGLGALNLNVMNFLFLFIGLALFTRPEAYDDEFGEAVMATSGIVLQFPFYAGIIGMMNASGLSTTLAEALVSVSTPATFPAVAWITAGFINFFVPSGGGEWTVVGQTVLEAAGQLGVPPGQAVVAYAVGDAHTNLFQPFWALPLLGITGMRARDVFGYAATMMLLLVPFLAVALVVIPY